MLSFYHIFTHTFIHTLLLTPYLFITYLALEYIEKKTDLKQKNFLQKQHIATPILAAALSIIPHCGIAIMAANFYAARLISVGTLLAVFLATSDEMIPVLISNKIDLSVIFYIVSIKTGIAAFVGVCTDILIKRKMKKTPPFSMHHICQKCHCHCENGILKAALIHTKQISILIFCILLIFNSISHTIGNENMQHIFSDTHFSAFFACLIGLIPTCGTSVFLTQLFTLNTLPFGALMAGLMLNASVGTIVLFQMNRPMRHNFYIITALFIISCVSGYIINYFA